MAKLLGGVKISVDGVPCDAAPHVVHEDMMLNDGPDMPLAFGYTNASQA